MAALSHSSHFLHHLRRPSPPSPLSPPRCFLLPFFSKPSSRFAEFATASSHCVTTPARETVFVSLSRTRTLARHVLFFQSSAGFTPRSYSSRTADISSEEGDEGDDIEDGVTDELDDELHDDDERQTDSEDFEVEDSVRESLAKKNQESRSEVPKLTVKEKKELASYAHSLGKKLKSQLVGKSGVTSNVASSFNETLEANELLKIKIHRTCPGELADVIKQLEEATGSVVVGQIGRTVIVYKPSLKKLQMEERKKQARRVFVRKGIKSKPTLVTIQSGWEPRTSGRGRRGSSRF